VAFTRKEPIGVVVAVSAFNHPLNLIVHQVGPAVAAGCPVIVKPASDTPLSCFRFVQMLNEAGLPPGWCQALVAKRDDATRLVTDPRVAFFSFIGSSEIGWGLRSKLAPGTRCALEHGGAAPVIVAADADLDTAIPLLSKGGFYHAGQVCVSVQRVFAHESIAKDLASRLAEAGNQLKIGDPTLGDTDVGPLIRPQEVDRVESWVNEAFDAGTEVLSGAKRISDSCYECTVLFDPPANAKVSEHEVFGPVICVYPYADLDDAIWHANSLPLAFQAAVFTRDVDTAMHAYNHLDGSAIMVNDHTAFRVDWMPFAGLKHSGLGVGGIPHTMHDMQIEKMLVLRSPSL
jgi:acyl-CoA reductase-like NAD-dependent aldehyde dehydrogenase